MTTNGLAAKENISAITKLTALWGLAESGLGGIMFAFHIPFTGFLIGAVAIVILSLIAHFSHHNYRQIISATVIVIMVKAAVSPHSPPPAYFAVAFQGLLAALLFGTLPSHRLACLLLGILSMAESALQKFIMLTLVFGKSVWEAVNNVGKEIAKTFSIQSDHNYALWIIGIYVLIYMIWGAVVGSFAAGASMRVERQKNKVMEGRQHLRGEQPLPSKRSSRKEKRLIIYALTLFFIVAVFLLSGASGKKVLEIVLRSAAALLLLLLVVQPLLKYLFSRWLAKRSESEQARSRQVLQLLPALRSHIPDAYALAKMHKGFFKRLGGFATAMIVLTLYGEEEIYRN